MATITNLQKVPCAIRVLHVGGTYGGFVVIMALMIMLYYNDFVGTIKSCQQFLALHNKKKLKEMVESTANPGIALSHSQVG